MLRWRHPAGGGNAVRAATVASVVASSAHTADPARSASRGTLSLVTTRTFGPYFFGNLTSNVGQWFHNLAAAWLVFQLTGSSVAVGAVAIAQFTPTLALSPYAGAITDRVDRRLLLLSGQTVAFVSAAILTAWVAVAGVDGLPGPWPVLGATLGMGLGYAFSVPAMQALVPSLVEPSDLAPAVALNSVTFNVARAVGPALAGVSLLAFGPAVTFGVNAVTYVPLLVALLVIRPRVVFRNGQTDRSIRAGLRYLRQDPSAAVLLLGTAALGLTTDPVNTLTPGMAKLLGGNEGLVSLFVAAFGIGAAVATTQVSRLRRRFEQPVLAVAGLVVLSAGIATFGVAPVPVAGMAALAIAGSGFLIATTALTTLLQQRVPEDLRGRVMALWGVAFLGSRPLAAALDGAVADMLGVRVGVMIASAFGILAVLVLRRHGLRQLATPSPRDLWPLRA